MGEVLAGVPDSGRDLTDDLHQEWLGNRNSLEGHGEELEFLLLLR